jgi:hypothetical protein
MDRAVRCLKKNQSNYQEKFNKVLGLKREHAAVRNGFDIRQADRLNFSYSAPSYHRIFSFLDNFVPAQKETFHLLRRLIRGHLPKPSCNI